MLRVPSFALLSLLTVALSLPLGAAFYLGPLQLETLPILGVISLYLALGIGVDAIFVFCNAHIVSSTESAARLTTSSTGSGVGPIGSDGARTGPIQPAQKSPGSSRGISSHGDPLSPNTADGVQCMPLGSHAAPNADIDHGAADESACGEGIDVAINTGPSSSATDDTGGGGSGDNGGSAAGHDNGECRSPRCGDGGGRSLFRMSDGRAQEAAALSVALRDAFAVVGLTTTTTAVSFAAGLASPITPVRQFSIFQLCIIAAYSLLLAGLFIPLLFLFRTRLLRARCRPSPPKPPSQIPVMNPCLVPGIQRIPSRIVRRLCAPFKRAALLVLAPAEHAFWSRLAPALCRWHVALTC